jgi:bifunctional UDP-N-acetylglucosamine pyrophosphorylase/glucosamine-1-phosphate N-acetyltransferase
MPGSIIAIVLAAGEGTRMKSNGPKVLHMIAGRSMLAHVLASVECAGIGEAVVVVGPGRDDVGKEAAAALPGTTVAVQEERRGTAHAVLAARTAIRPGSDIIVLYGDTPLVRPAAIRSLVDALAQGAAVAVLGFEAADPEGYGRLLIKDGVLDRIVEEKDATPAERSVTTCMGGLMALSGRTALAILDAIGSDNAKGEFYLTDAVAVARSRGLLAVARTVPAEDVRGVNDRIQLAAAEAILQTRLRERAMADGATLVAPETVFLSYDTILGRDVVVEPHCWFGRGVSVETGAVIHGFSHIERAHIAADASIGPFARIRPGTRVGRKARIGNFVEVKATIVEDGAKINHLSYIGDASVGSNANIGAGTITCNYDGFGKARTEIGAEAFIGSNSALVAPVRIGAGANVGAGSVITKDVAPDALAVARGRQVEKAGWAASFRKRRAAEKEASSTDR